MKYSPELNRQRVKTWRAEHPLKAQLSVSHARGLGFNPLNNLFKGAATHHLHLEGNPEFVVLIPSWLHRLAYHNTKTGRGMDTINSLALDFWINEDLYLSLFELTPIPIETDPIDELLSRSIDGTNWI